MKISIDVSVTENGRRAPEYTINTDLRGEISLGDLLEFTKQSLISTSFTVLQEEQANGFDKKPVVTVDGSSNKSVLDVSPLGTIEYTSRVSVDALLLDAYQGLLDRSPVLTGAYKSSHYVFLNSKQIANSLDSLQTWINSSPEVKTSDVFLIVNVQPYARKLERFGVRAGGEGGNTHKPRLGQSRDKKKAQRGVKVLVPNGAYFLTARALRYKYKRNTSIRFQFSSGTTFNIVGSFKSGHKSGKGRAYLYPTIRIAVSEEGLA